MRYAQYVQQHFDVVGQSGQEATCHCPFCGDGGKPTFYVNVIRGLYVCFKCGEKGHLKQFGQMPNQTTQGLRERLKAVSAPEKPTQTYPEGWLKQFDAPTDYWTVQRGLSPATVARFGLGFDPFSNRVTLPLRDLHGRILGVTYRRLDDGRPKYLHPKGFPIGRHLYGAWLLNDQTKVALVEGQVDAVSCWEARVPALALMGARLTRDQVKVLQRAGIRTVVLMTDNDNAGIGAVPDIYDSLRGTGIRVLVGWYRPYWRVKDPDSLKPDRRRKMYHSAVSFQDWLEMQSG